MRAIGRQDYVLGHVCAVENQRVVPALSVDRVAPVTRVPGHSIISFAEQDDVVPSTATYDIVARSADDRIGAVTSGDRVVALPTVQYQRYIESREAIRGSNRVRSTQSINRELQRAN